jgi:hypothetical protein
VRLTVCGEPLALSATLTDALSEPNAVGVKVTVMAQEAPAARLAPQVGAGVGEKDVMFGPVMEILLIVRGAVPVFFNVIGWLAADTPITVLAKVSEVGERVAIGLGTTPVPVRLTVCGEPLALSVIAILALRVPLTRGWNFTVIVQEAPGATGAAQVPDAVKDPAPASVSTMGKVATNRFAVPVFLTVMV